MLQELREQLVQLHLDLPKNNLVVWTGGNVSARDADTGLMVIKASGIRYDKMGPEHMVVMDMARLLEAISNLLRMPTAIFISTSIARMWAESSTRTRATLRHLPQSGSRFPAC
jgi:ribulose-5-phosphate 4-epimerase/fuculose-1-phosphate aldolase